MANTKTLEKENFLHFDVVNFRKKYKVEIIIEESDEDRTRITYEVSVENLEALPSGNYLCYFTSNDFLINRKEPDLVMEQLANKCRKPFETMVFIIAKNGEILGINNHEDIIERWEVTKKSLKIEYAGKEFEKYVSIMDNVIANREVFLSKIKHDIFISQFFYPMYEEAFVRFVKKNREKIKFFNINYDIDILMEVQDEGYSNEDGHLIIHKKINTEEYDFSKMPIDFFTTEYALDKKMEIVKIKGKFENHNRIYIFNIIEK